MPHDSDNSAFKDLPPRMAHRGESANAPENTLAAIRLAAQNGIQWTELDASISSDAIAYVHHDDTLDRCTDGSGYLLSKPSTELDRLDAGSWFSNQFSGEPLPRLSSVLQEMARLNMGLNLEIKPTAGAEIPTTSAICNVIKDAMPLNIPVVLSSFSEVALAHARELLPEIPRGLIVTAIPDDWHGRLMAHDCKSFHCAGEFLTYELAQAIKTENYALMCWTVNDTDTARQLWSWGVDAVISDNPAALQLPAS